MKKILCTTLLGLFAIHGTTWGISELEQAFDIYWKNPLNIENKKLVINLITTEKWSKTQEALPTLKAINNKITPEAEVVQYQKVVAKKDPFTQMDLTEEGNIIRDIKTYNKEIKDTLTTAIAKLEKENHEIAKLKTELVQLKTSLNLLQGKLNALNKKLVALSGKL